jgi:hypothetical protein
MYFHNLARLTAGLFPHNVLHELGISTTDCVANLTVQSRRLCVPPELGELIERRKIISLCPIPHFMDGASKRLLIEIPSAMIEEAVLSLTFSGFFSESIVPDRSERKLQCARCLLAELRVTRDTLFYSHLLARFALAENR